MLEDFAQRWVDITIRPFIEFTPFTYTVSHIVLKLLVAKRLTKSPVSTNSTKKAYIKNKLTIKEQKLRRSTDI